MSRQDRGGGFVLALVMAIACSKSDPPAGSPSMAQGGRTGRGGTGAGAGAGGAGGTVSPANPPTGNDAASDMPGSDSAPPASDASPDLSSPDVRISDDVPPPSDAASEAGRPAFPLAEVKAAKPERIVAVGGHIEGPSWRDGEIYFAQDGPGGGVMRIDAAGKLFRYHPQLRPIGSFALADGSVLFCDHQLLLVQMFKDGKVGVLADDTATFCNDLSVDRDGNIYFSDFESSIFRVTPGGQISRALTGIAGPNGIEVDPDSRFIYINSGQNVFRAALPTGTGGFGKPELVTTLEAGGDGLTFDEAGYLWVAVYRPGTIAIVDPVKRAVLASLKSGAGSMATNLVFGGPARDTLYVTVGGSGVWRLPVGVRGFAGHPGAPAYRVRRMLNLSPANQPVN